MKIHVHSSCYYDQGQDNLLDLLVSDLNVNKKYMKMTKDVVLEGSSQEAKKDFITRRNGQGPKHLKFFLLVFLK